MLRIYELFCKPNYSKTFFSIGILQRLRFASYKQEFLNKRGKQQQSDKRKKLCLLNKKKTS